MPDTTKRSFTDEEALAFHRSPPPGKISITPTKPMATQRDLSLAYSPGVAVPVRAIAESGRTQSDHIIDLWHATGGDPAKGPDERFRHLFGVLYSAQAAATRAVRPGVPCEAIDAAARRCGWDRAALRRLNMVPSSAMPMVNALGEQVDSGAFAETLDLALAAADIDGFDGRRRDSEARGHVRGLGFAYHIKGTGGQPHENAEIRFEPGGTLTLTVGTLGTGQGHETTFPQIVADRLGLPNALIRHRQGDTDLIAIGGGSGSSRSTYMAGTAIWRAWIRPWSRGAGTTRGPRTARRWWRSRAGSATSSSSASSPPCTASRASGGCRAACTWPGSARRRSRPAGPAGP